MSSKFTFTKPLYKANDKTKRSILLSSIKNGKDEVTVKTCLANRLYEQSKLELGQQEEPTKYSWIDDFLWDNKIQPPKSEFFWVNPDEELWNIFVFGYIRNYWSKNKIFNIESCPKEIILVLIAYSNPGSSKRKSNQKNNNYPYGSLQIKVSINENPEKSEENYEHFGIEKSWNIKNVKGHILNLKNIITSYSSYTSSYSWRSYQAADFVEIEKYKLWTLADYVKQGKKQNHKPQHSHPANLEDEEKRDFYCYGWRGYKCFKDKENAGDTLQANEKYILSKSKPKYENEGRIYGWEGDSKYYTIEELRQCGWVL